MCDYVNMVSFPSALEGVCRYWAALVEHSGDFSGKPSMSQGIFCYTRNMLHSTPIFFAFNQIICKLKLVQLHYHQIGCHNTALKMKTKFLVSKNFNVQREREETCKTRCFLFSALCCSSLSVTVYKPRLACKEVFVAGAGCKKGRKIRVGGTWVLFLFHNRSPGQRLDYRSAQIKIYMLTWAPVNNSLSARVNFNAALNQAVKSQEIPNVQILLQLCTGCVAWLSYCRAHI